MIQSSSQFSVACLYAHFDFCSQMLFAMLYKPLSLGHAEESKTQHSKGRRIYWSALVPQMHITLIDLFKHYHSQLTLGVQTPSPCCNQWQSIHCSIPPPLLHDAVEPKQIDSYMSQEAEMKASVSQSGPPFQRKDRQQILQRHLIVRWEKERWLELNLSKRNPRGSALNSSAI